jgi:L-aspartate oxidase
VILTTGGAGQVFERNLNPSDVTGDGYALGFEAGAKLINMEFMQAGIGISHPATCLLNAYIWSGMPRVTDRDGREFLKEKMPTGVTLEQVMTDHSNHFPFSTSDRSYLLESLIQEHLLEGKGTNEGGVYMDLTNYSDEYVSQLPEDSGIRKMWPIARDYYLSRGVDVLREPVQIACFAHAINGGLLIDGNSMTTLPGLFAAGETAGGGTGPRLGHSDDDAAFKGGVAPPLLGRPRAADHGRIRSSAPC